MPPLATLAWWGATACWLLGSLLGGPRTAVEAAVPLPVAILAYVVCAGLWALLVYGAFFLAALVLSAAGEVLLLRRR